MRSRKSRAYMGCVMVTTREMSSRPGDGWYYRYRIIWPDKSGTIGKNVYGHRARAWSACRAEIETQLTPRRWMGEVSPADVHDERWNR